MTMEEEELENYKAWVDAQDLAAIRQVYGCAPRVRRSADPVIAYAASQGKTLFSVRAGGVTTYHVVSVREFANRYACSVSTSRKAMSLLGRAQNDEAKSEVFAALRRTPQPVGTPRTTLETLWRRAIGAPRKTTPQQWSELWAAAQREIAKYRDALWEAGIDPDAILEPSGASQNTQNARFAE